MEDGQNNIDSTGKFPVQGAACVVVDTTRDLFYITQEKESAWRKQSGHLGLPGGRQEPNENIIDLMKRELHEEAGITHINEESLVNIGNITLNDVTGSYPQIDVALFSLFSHDLSPVDNEEVHGILVTKRDLGTMITQNPYQFRPLVLEALYFYILKQHTSVKTIQVTDSNYNNISPKMIKSLLGYYQ